MQLVIPQSFLYKETRLHISIKMTSNTRQCKSGAGGGSVTSVDWHFANVTAADQTFEGKRDHLMSFRKQEQAPKVEGVPEVHAGRAEDLTSRENALMRQPVKASTHHHDSPMELMASETQGEGERQRQKQRRQRKFER